MNTFSDAAVRTCSRAVWCHSFAKTQVEHLTQERTAHLASYTFLQGMLITIKIRHFHSSINTKNTFFTEHFITSYFRPMNIAKLLRTAFSQNTFRSSRLQMFFKISVLKSFPNFIGKRLYWSLFLKRLQAEGLQLYFKKTLTKVFSCEVCKIIKNTFFYRTPPVTASALPLAASAFLLKSN